MWKVLGADVVAALQGGGGERFTAFVDALIYAHASAHGLPFDRIRSNERANQADGGVDTHLLEGLPEERTGWLRTPTCWQYRATASRGVTKSVLLRELRKPRVRQLLSEGRAYRFAICDGVPEPKIEKWTRWLSEAIRAFAPHAPPPRVVTAEHLATWAGHFPGVIARFFRRDQFDVEHLESWGRGLTNATTSYVRVLAWRPQELQLEEHVDLSRATRTPVLPVLGEAGIGKSRLVFETLRRVGAGHLVVYTDDEQQARKLARIASAHDEVHAILVADECSLATRAVLEETLRGATGRVRVVAIHNESEEVTRANARPWLAPPPDEVVQQILGRNFPAISGEALRRYAALARGCVRLAADLCANDHLFVPGEPVHTGLSAIQSYYARRLPDRTDQDAVAVLALLTHVGFRGEVHQELAQLCAALGRLDPRVISDAAHRLRNAPGFVVVAGRFLHVAPKGIACLAFEDAWSRWLEPDLAGFVARLPSALVSSFLARVASIGTPQVRERVGAEFREWAEGLSPDALEDDAAVHRLEALIDTEPVVYLPILASLVQRSADPGDILPRGLLGGRGPRRRLIFLAERILALPEAFHPMEEVLFRLALHENEPNVMNNATGIWQQIHRPYLSGTPIPFATRFAVLERRVFSSDAAERQLARTALDRALEVTDIQRREHPPLVAGRVPPRDWQPTSSSEAEECATLPLALLGRMRASGLDELPAAGFDLLLTHLGTLLRQRQLVRVRAACEIAPISEIAQARLVNALQGFRDVEQTVERRGLGPHFVQDLREWIGALAATDVHGRLVQALAHHPWDQAAADRWEVTLTELARELLAAPHALQAELGWLTSESARSAWVFGFYVGRLDAQATMYDLFFETATDGVDCELRRGYVTGLLAVHPVHVDRLRRTLDRLEPSQPQAAHNLALAARRHSDCLPRALRLVDQGRLPSTVLSAFTLELDGHTISPTDVRDLLVRLAAPTPDEGLRSTQLHIGLDLLAFELQRRAPELPGVFLDAELREAIWPLLGLPAGRSRHANDMYHWQQILVVLSTLEPERTATLAADAVLSDVSPRRDAGLEVLTHMNEGFPELVVRELGRVVLDPERGDWCLFGEEAQTLVAALDEEHVGRWLDTAGTAGARAIASCLPTPSTIDGQHVVPGLTRMVLSRFGDDDRTVRAFCRRGIIRVYSGDIASAHDADAAAARPFVTHAIPAIRRWARQEVAARTAEASDWRRDDEEERILE